MDALSGLDPKYIDEAAFELHGKPVKRSPKKSKVLRGAFIALPIAAALLITVMVALPALFRMGMDSGTSMSSDTGSYAPASEEAASYDAEAPSISEAPSYSDAIESEAEADYASEATEAAAEADYAPEDSVNASASAKSEDTAEIEAVTGTASESTETAGMADTETAGAEISTEYVDGILTIENITLPEDIAEAEYKIAKTTATGTEITYSEGSLEDIITETEPLTLDLSDLILPEGTYTITIGDEIAEFTFQR